MQLKTSGHTPSCRLTPLSARSPGSGGLLLSFDGDVLEQAVDGADGQVGAVVRPVLASDHQPQVTGSANDPRGHYVHARAAEVDRLLAAPAPWRAGIEVDRLTRMAASWACRRSWAVRL